MSLLVSTVGRMNWRGTTDSGDILFGRGLRFVLVAEIRRRRTMTVAEMVEVLAGYGYELNGRPSKVISDALRWEVASGRVKRLGRGIYSHGHTPRTTARRIDLFARMCLAWIQARVAGGPLPPTPEIPAYRRYRYPPPQDPAWPPWKDLRWLWAV